MPPLQHPIPIRPQYLLLIITHKVGLHIHITQPVIYAVSTIGLNRWVDDQPRCIADATHICVTIDVSQYDGVDPLTITWTTSTTIPLSGNDTVFFYISHISTESLVSASSKLNMLPFTVVSPNNTISSVAIKSSMTSVLRVNIPVLAIPAGNFTFGTSSTCQLNDPSS
jgi:hypothetical protein